MREQQWENELRDALSAAARDISAPEGLKAKIDYARSMDMQPKFKTIKWRKLIVTAAIIASIGITGALAAGKIAFTRGSSSSLENMSYEKTVKAADYVSAGDSIPEEFSNGFVFQKGYHVYKEAVDESDTTVDKAQEIHADYKKDDITLSVSVQEENENFGGDDSAFGETSVINGIDVGYSETLYMCVPADYELTSEEQQEVDKGSLMVGYGSREKEYKVFEFAAWTDNGVRFAMIGFDMNLGSNEFFQMAEEIINR